jgi:RiboL-PSP-HEPN
MDNEQEHRPTLLQQVQADQIRKEQIQAFFDRYIKRLTENNDRVSRLLDLFDHLDELDVEGGEDLLRAAVVFIHAYLEDFLRTIAIELLPAGDETCLKDIPLAGTGSFGRSEKFVLGQLAQHRGKMVDALLTESVSDYYGRSTFNSTDEISSLVKRVGFTPEEHNADFEAIDQMIRRRHQIVHRADRVKDPASDSFVLQPIKRSEVVRWLQATLTFTSGLIDPLLRKLPELKPKV